MHPQIVRDTPGSCPICGMALEPREVTAEDTNPELADMTRRLWISVALAVPMLALMVSAFLPSMPMQHLFSARAWAWIEFALATPVVLWCGLPFFVEGLAIHRASQPEHVYAYRLGTGRPTFTASSQPSFLRYFQRRFVGAEDRSMCISSRRQSSSLWFF
jgi:cation transport ATPase